MPVFGNSLNGQAINLEVAWPQLVQILAELASGIVMPVLAVSKPEAKSRISVKAFTKL